LSDLPNYIAEFCDDEASQSRSDLLRSWALGIALATCFKLKRKEASISLEHSNRSRCFSKKKYRGSLSGEHGDGIVRGSFTFYDWR
jgi:hypothetical protein